MLEPDVAHSLMKRCKHAPSDRVMMVEIDSDMQYATEVIVVNREIRNGDYGEPILSNYVVARLDGKGHTASGPHDNFLWPRQNCQYSLEF